MLVLDLAIMGVKANQEEENNMDPATRKVLGRWLSDLDCELYYLDMKVLEAATRVGCHEKPEQQLERAKDPIFVPPIKTRRDQMLERRNALAKVLGFGPREAHVGSSRDYQVSDEGLIAV